MITRKAQVGLVENDDPERRGHLKSYPSCPPTACPCSSSRPTPNSTQTSLQTP